jgi:LTXXQ motif family protein
VRRLGPKSPVAYLEVKLNLTDQQRDLWNKWQQAKPDAATQYRAACIEHQATEKRPIAVEWVARRERFLTAELHQAEAERPALLALYDALTPEQKILFDESHRHHPGWGHHRHERHDRDRGGTERE